MIKKDDTISRSWLITQVKKHKSKLILANLIAVLATLISVPIPLLMPLMVDEVLLDQPANGIAAMNAVLPAAWHTPTGYIFFTLFLVVLMRAASQALNIVQSRQFTLVSKTITFEMRSKMIDKLGRISIRQYETKGSGGINAHLITDIETIDQFIGSTLAKFVVSLLTVIGTAIVLLWLDWRLGLFILLVNPVVIYFSRKLGSMVKHLKRKENHSFELFQTRLVETLDGIYQLRAANKEREFLQQLKNSADQVRVDADKYAWQSEAAGRVSFLLFLIGFELFRAVAMLMVLFSDLTIGQIFAVFGYLWFMLSPVQELLGIQFSWYSAKAALKRINDLLLLEEEHRPPSKVNPFTDDREVDVKVENVNFSYNSEHNVLDNLSLHIPAGKKVALVGASGGGKSTLIQLLIGVYQQNSGHVRYNDELTQDIGFDVIRDKIAVVLQQPILFNDTLRHNLTLGGNFDEMSLWRALDVAQLQDVISQLNHGLDTQIGRNGIRLSGGQRQRLAIARMVLSNPQFVILDEATSALDTATEAALHKALTEFLRGRTTLIVAHRLSAVKQADLIYVLEDGKVTQTGTHGELVEQEGLYQTLYGGIQSHA
ncbi:MULTISPECIES: ABC transporter ATP-binding protein [Vibrio]|jgi:ATP-binding cassette subfamily C protein|uniref:ABC transporter ATP-binding protein n=1 Tax=Vibrio natriegens NBRC 15636 = ATCC 14048 = DSM 759 TaxID=1219067 RepID=A0AAN1CWI3_VIBNA|nr:ABC transporter ATP-binding protein [Vibrio natriegens]MEE3877877.1 ABC transporter ATP-binding protein [Vibrio sp. YYF0003]ALR15475.1 ABC transporter ATP-binding protein [Vibrio natriegens NBRC 15636 = ATCC 14048 = DSM 759]ANQ12665.1 ABC transporter ATP-binding protein [Vibrio natriegens NBRC 15636 = ATCC 14048 = DSM 759]EPM42255.1 ABC transporter ATP-binding protein [Vibrio natriegens NBRC 15636 = ATCC 14048 = DSM 759]MCG9702104.1 ABC transporter ATP-binding protein/permease [Vibrio natri